MEKKRKELEEKQKKMEVIAQKRAEMMQRRREEQKRYKCRLLPHFSAVVVCGLSGLSE